MISQNVKEKNYFWFTLIILIFVAMIFLFFYLDRHNELSQIIRQWHLGGILLSILLMAALCMTPIPSEGLLVLLLKIYGIYEGILYSWLGMIISSLAIFYLARHSGPRLFQKMITPRYLELVEHWIREKGSMGLLIARLFPLPPFAVNFIAGASYSVKFWPYLWTAALSIIPYYVGFTLIYIGVLKSIWIGLVIAGIIIFSLLGVSYIARKIPNNNS
jgi:uncharacterized membrane protein YdjX (TVP38/TMEM64 family)